MKLVIVKVVISSEVRDIEFIQIRMQDIRISVSTQYSLPCFFVRLLCPHLIEEQLPISLNAY